LNRAKDTMASFSNTSNPTPFGFFDTDSIFQDEADNIVTFIKRKLGDDILSVELTKKQIWANFEEAFCEYGSIINQYQAKSQLVDFLGIPTGSLTGSEQKYPRNNLELLTRLAEPYAQEAVVGGSYNFISGSIALEQGRQDYDMYTELKDHTGTLVVSSSLNPHAPNGKMKIGEVFHFSPQAAYRFFDTTSAVNYLNNEFSFESFTPETIFYVLPVFEDILRAGQLDISNRVRRSHYSYEIQGTKLRIYPKPTQDDPKNLIIKVHFQSDPLNPAYKDGSIYGVSNLSNIPFGNLSYKKINSIGRQWIRQYAHAMSKEQLGLIRTKFGSVPIPEGQLTLNGDALITQGREDKTTLVTQLKEMLDSMTYDKLVETQATRAEMMQKQLRFIPMPNGKAIFMG
jgi:hypothetical protein